MIRKFFHRSPGCFIQSFIATIETILNKYVMIQISESGLDIQSGKVRNVRYFLVELRRKH